MINSSVTIYECRCVRQDVGRETGSLDSPLRRKADGSLQIVDVGEYGYFHKPSAAAFPEWIDLFVVPNGHGAQLLGYFQADNFDIKKM